MKQSKQNKRDIEKLRTEVKELKEELGWCCKKLQRIWYWFEDNIVVTEVEEKSEKKEVK